MKHMEIFEQAMCCPTGLCGPSIDPELLRVSTVLDTLKQHGIDVGRYNLTSAPLKFVQTKAVTDFLQHHGPEDLPLILVDGASSLPAAIRRMMNLPASSASTRPSSKPLRPLGTAAAAATVPKKQLPAVVAIHRLKAKPRRAAAMTRRRNRKARRAVAEATVNDAL